MSTMTTDTVRITIEAPLPTVVDDLADPLNHPEWATEFFIGPALPAEGDEVLVTVPRMGGEVHMRVDADVATGTTTCISHRSEPRSARHSRFVWSRTEPVQTCCSRWPACQG